MNATVQTTGEVHRARVIGPENLPSYRRRDAAVDAEDARRIREHGADSVIHHLDGLEGYRWSETAVVKETVGYEEYAWIAVHLQNKGHLETLREILAGNWHGDDWLLDRSDDALEWAAQDEWKAHRVLRDHGLAEFTEVGPARRYHGDNPWVPNHPDFMASGDRNEAYAKADAWEAEHDRIAAHGIEQ